MVNHGRPSIVPPSAPLCFLCVLSPVLIDHRQLRKFATFWHKEAFGAWTCTTGAFSKAPWL